MPRRKGSCRNKRGGAAGSANPSSYNDGQSYMRATVGEGNQQWDNVFKQGTPGQSNAIKGLEGQRAGSRKRRRSKKGGFFGSIINQAIVPFGILGLQQSYGRKRKHGGTKKNRRH